MSYLLFITTQSDTGTGTEKSLSTVTGHKFLHLHLLIQGNGRWSPAGALNRNLTKALYRGAAKFCTDTFGSSPVTLAPEPTPSAHRTYQKNTSIPDGKGPTSFKLDPETQASNDRQMNQFGCQGRIRRLNQRNDK